MYNNRHEEIVKINILDKISEFPVCFFLRHSHSALSYIQYIGQ